jgi:hypothetical protein
VPAGCARLADDSGPTSPTTREPPAVWRGPRIVDDEVGPFVRALDEGLVALDRDTATVTFPGLSRAASKRYELLYSYVPSATDPAPKLGWSWQERPQL